MIINIFTFIFNYILFENNLQKPSLCHYICISLFNVTGYFNVVMNIPNSIKIFIGLVGAVFRADIHG